MGDDLDVVVAHEFLDDGEVDAAGQKHGGEGVTADMGGERFGDAGESGDGLDADILVRKGEHPCVLLDFSASL